MWLVLTAMRRPITIVVAVLAIGLMSVIAMQRMKVDIFPQLGAPAIYVAQPYGGMDPAQMEGYLTYYYEYHFLYITGIEHVESKNIQGIALMKLVFHPETDMSQAMAEVVGYVNRARAFMPPGAVPPFIMRYDAGSVPVAQLVFSSDTRTPGEMQDIALNRVRPIFATLPGVSAPPPFGGSQRTIVVRVDPGATAAVRPLPRGSRHRSQSFEHRRPFRQCSHGRPDSYCVDERDARRQHPGIARCPVAGGERPDGLPARRRHDHRHDRHHRRLRARGRQTDRLYSGHEARRRLHARRHSPRPAGPAGHAKRRARKTSRLISCSTSRDTS